MDAQALTRQDVEAPLPPSLLTWIPHLWRRALFPGKAQAITRWKWLPFLTMILLPGCLLYPCLFFPLFEPDESRYAQIPREMLQQGEWVVPTLQGQPYLDKPPLFYWLVMGSYRLFGESGESARLIPALCVHLTLLTVWFFARRWVGDLAAFLGSLLLCIAPGFLTMGRLLLLDGLLTFLVILALFSAYEALRGETLHRGWWTLSAFAGDCDPASSAASVAGLASEESLSTVSASDSHLSPDRDRSPDALVSHDADPGS